MNIKLSINEVRNQMSSAITEYMKHHHGKIEPFVHKIDFNHQIS